MRHAILFLSVGSLLGAAAGAAAIRFIDRPHQVNLTALPDPPRIERPCNPASADTAIILTHGQSNAANFGSYRYTARGAVDNFDPANGKCFAAADPLPGTTGSGGNFATRLGDLLIDAGRYKRVVIIPIAFHGASLLDLTTIHMERIDNAIVKLKAAQLVPTHILFQQGEKDAELPTTPQDYVALLHKIVGRFRAGGIRAPFYVSQSTKCDFVDVKNSSAVRAGQLAAIDTDLDIRRGPDTDLIGNDGRNPIDGCHMNAIGTLANAALWATYIK